MGSCDEDANNGIDPTVGGLVWVRRRNGSWWPGRILGPDELPEGCLPAPRSGTPVKLLGREDASVDWYNLEKSKRVKPFRCGEYDDCIEKAKACASHPSKKAVKYARREDAILHALELEDALLGKNTQNEHQHHVNESPPSSSSQQHPTEETQDDSSSSEEDDPDLPRSGVSFEDPGQVDPFINGSKRRRTPNDSEEDGMEGVKRMRGLEDLGMNVKRLTKVASGNNEFLKRKNYKRRNLAKVLESTPAVCVPVSTDGFELESKINGSLLMNSNNNNNLDSTNGVSCENVLALNISTHAENVKSDENEIFSLPEIPEDESCVRLFDVPLLAEEKQFTGLSSGNEEHSEACSTSSESADFHNVNLSQKIEKAASEWQLKGKRNTRPRKTETDDVAAIGGPHKIADEIPDEEFRGWSWNSPRGESQRSLPYRLSRFTVNPKYDSFDFSLGHLTNDAGPTLYEVKVNVEVKAGYSSSQHVPYISLMSKSNGRPIVGHPISIEVLILGGDDVAEVVGRRQRGRPPVSKSRSRKSKRGGVLSKKIRKLSSLSGSHGQSQSQQYETKTVVVEKVSKGPSIACVPLNVVFSRINAALNSSIRHAPRFS